MRLPFLHQDQAFPPTAEAWPEGSEAPGLLAAGADLSPQRLELAYSQGIFPWFSVGQPVLWWSTAPRMLLQTANFSPSHSLRKRLRQIARSDEWEIRMDGGFDQVIQACAKTPREGQNGTWIVDDMVQAYQAWHRLGCVHSVETWHQGELVGGLYCVHIGRMLYGESMFSWRTDASKIALSALVAWARKWQLPWIDCQQQTRHLASLGAAPVSRELFERGLKSLTNQACAANWQFEREDWRYLEMPDINRPVAL